MHLSASRRSFNYASANLIGELCNGFLLRRSGWGGVHNCLSMHNRNACIPKWSLKAKGRKSRWPMSVLGLAETMEKRLGFDPGRAAHDVFHRDTARPTGAIRWAPSGGERGRGLWEARGPIARPELGPHQNPQKPQTQITPKGDKISSTILSRIAS